MAGLCSCNGPGPSDSIPPQSPLSLHSCFSLPSPNPCSLLFSFSLAVLHYKGNQQNCLRFQRKKARPKRHHPHMVRAQLSGLLTAHTIQRLQILVESSPSHLHRNASSAIIPNRHQGESGSKAQQLTRSHSPGPQRNKVSTCCPWVDLENTAGGSKPTTPIA